MNEQHLLDLISILTRATTSDRAGHRHSVIDTQTLRDLNQLEGRLRKSRDAQRNR